MTRKLTFIVVFFVSSVVLASTVLAQAIISRDEIKKIVTFIFPPDDHGNLRRDPNNNPIPYGTGFFVILKNDTGKGSGEGAFVYLVTAKHVLKDENGADFDRVYLRLDTLKGEAAFVPLDLIQNGQRLVFTHADPTVDIAVVPAIPSQTLFDFKVMSEDLLSTKETFTQYNIAEGSNVFFVGLFTTYYGEHANVPIFRFGRMAMFPDEPVPWIDYDGQPQQQARLYLIEIQSYGGNSGSPVFFSLGATEQRAKPGNVLLVGSPLLKLAGVMRGRFNDLHPPIGFLQTPTASTPVPLPNIGIAAVTPSYFLHDILFSDTLKKFRADHAVAEPLGKSDQPGK
jgi:hypothetical protein